MSDARQAIAAARVAGATEGTSPDYYAAQAAIARAEKHLEAREYTRARYAAMEAKRHAAAALAGAQHSDGTIVVPPGVVPPGVAAPGAAAPGSAVPVTQPH